MPDERPTYSLLTLPLPSRRSTVIVSAIVAGLVAALKVLTIAGMAWLDSQTPPPAVPASCGCGLDGSGGHAHAGVRAGIDGLRGDMTKAAAFLAAKPHDPVTPPKPSPKPPTGPLGASATASQAVGVATGTPEHATGQLGASGSKILNLAQIHEHAYEGSPCPLGYPQGQCHRTPQYDARPVAGVQSRVTVKTKKYRSLLGSLLLPRSEPQDSGPDVSESLRLITPQRNFQAVQCVPGGG